MKIFCGPVKIYTTSFLAGCLFLLIVRNSLNFMCGSFQGWLKSVPNERILNESISEGPQQPIFDNPTTNDLDVNAPVSNDLNDYKIIFANDVPLWFKVPDGTDIFKKMNCSVDKCLWTSRAEDRNTADLVFFMYYYASGPRPIGQTYALYLLESPPNSRPLSNAEGINWTVTYRRDSTIPVPYGAWEYFNQEVRQMTQTKNYAENKTKKVAWFVSNCYARNGRLEYAQELQKHIQVDIYGACGNLSCPHYEKWNCYDMLNRDYKFYLAFENSNCKHYITEKFFETALKRNILPIVMGASKEDYVKYTPERSFIHVDDFDSPAELAKYLHVLDQDDELYNSYFKWRGTGKIIRDYRTVVCKMCARLHNKELMSKPSWYADVNSWWNGPGICTNKQWRNVHNTE